MFSTVFDVTCEVEVTRNGDHERTVLVRPVRQRQLPRVIISTGGPAASLVTAASSKFTESTSQHERSLPQVVIKSGLVLEWARRARN